MSLKKTEFLKLVDENKYLKQAYDEYIIVCGNNDNDYLTYIEIMNILNFHMYEFLECDYEFNVRNNNRIFCESREEYTKIWLKLGIQNYIMDVFYTTFYNRSTTGCEVVKKYPSMIYCISVSPPLDETPNTLYKVVKEITKLSGCENYYGVFEVGRTRKNFHSHVILKGKDKNFIANVKKKIQKTGWMYKLDFLKNSQHLLTTLRYLHSEGKDNKGIIGGDTNFNYFEALTNSTARRKCQTTEFENKIWNL